MSSILLLRIKDLYSKYKFIVWPIASGISCIIVLVFIVIPQLYVYIKSRGEVDNLKSQITILTAKAAELQNIDSAYNKTSLQAILNVLPADSKVPESFVLLQGLINTSGLVLKDVTYNAPSTPTTNNYHLIITVGGDITGLRTFLNKLNQIPRVFTADSLGIQIQLDGAEITATIPVTVYFDSNLTSSINLENSDVPKFTSSDQKFIESLTEKIALGESLAVSSSSSSGTVKLGKADPFQ